MGLDMVPAGNTQQSRFLSVIPGLDGDVAQAKALLANNSGIKGQLLNDTQFMDIIAGHVGTKLPDLVSLNLDQTSMMASLKSQIMAALQPRLQALQALSDQVRQYKTMGVGQGALVSQEQRVGSKGLVPLGLGLGTLAGTTFTWNVSGFQGISGFTDARVSFNDPTGALLYMSKFAIGTNTRFAIATSAFTQGFITSVARIREQHPAYQPGDGFFLGKMNLDNNTSVIITAEGQTGTAAGTQVLATLWGIPLSVPSGYTSDDCSCAATD